MVKLNLATLASDLYNNKWLIKPDAHVKLCQLVNKLMEDGLPPTYGEEENEFKFEGTIDPEEKDVVAVIYVNGILVKGASELEEAILGLCNTDKIAAALDDAEADPNVKRICLCFNSPGGSTVGIEELGRKIESISKTKQVIGWTESMACSAAYWLMSQCDILGMTPSATIGNVGVYSIIEDLSKAFEKEGINIQAIASGKYKLMGHPFKPLTDEEKNILQADVTKQHEKFKDVILSKREIEKENLEGLSYEGDEALELNFVDFTVDSLNELFDNIPIIENNLENNKSMLKMKNDKVAKAPEAKLMEAPKDEPKKEEVKAEAPKDEPKKEEEVPVKEDKKCIECPHCKKSFEYSEEEVEDKKMDDHKEPDGDEVPKEEKKAEEVKEDPKKEEKKATMPPMAEWNAHFGQKQAVNPFADACVEMLKNFAQLK